ncbi:MAG: phenylalanine--tRNA ligase beta subunit-related protein [Acidimicrobiia bacterium]
MSYFRYSREIIDRFPTIRGGVIHATGLTNTSTPPVLLEAFEGEQETVRQRLGDTPPSEIASLAAWRSAFSAFGVKPTQYRNAAEALLRRLSKQGSVPSINTLVDMASLVSLRYQLPVAVFDQHSVTGTTTVRFASGDEQFTDLGADSISHPEPGEVVFVDDDGLVSARRWCWRQSMQSAARSSTAEALITVEGQHSDAMAEVTTATNDLVGLLSEHQPQARLSSAILSPDSPQFPP